MICVHFKDFLKRVSSGHKWVKKKKLTPVADARECRLDEI